MTISMYEASAPIFVKMLGNTKAILRRLPRTRRRRRSTNRHS
jgi:hypothetical protein